MRQEFSESPADDSEGWRISQFAGFGNPALSTHRNGAYALPRQENVGELGESDSSLPQSHSSLARRGRGL